MAGIIEPGRPRVMQRSYRLRSMYESDGPRPLRACGARRGPLGDSLLPFGRLRRDSAVRRIDDPATSAGSACRDRANAAAATSPSRPRRRCACRPSRCRTRRCRSRAAAAAAFARGEFLVGDELPAGELGGPLERHALLVLVGEVARDIRVAPRRPRRRPLFRSLRGLRQGRRSARAGGRGASGLRRRPGGP